MCSECLAKTVAKQKKNTVIYRKKRVANGLCAYCGSPELLEGTTYCAGCRTVLAERNRDYRQAHPEVYRKHSKAHNRRLRREIIMAYGSACACCGESREEFLALDHVNGGGNAHRRETGRAGATMYRMVRRLGYPADFRLLCHNCNQSRGAYGYCPHELERVAEALIAAA